MGIFALATVFVTGFLIMTPVGPVSTICIRRALLYGRRAGFIAGAGDALAAAIYATVGVTAGSFVAHAIAPFATQLHLAAAAVLVVAATLLWRAKAAVETAAVDTRATLAGGFFAALLLALANPADVVLFAALFGGLGIVVRTPLAATLVFSLMFAGGCCYWIAAAIVLERGRRVLTPARVGWLNRVCAALMLVAALTSIVTALGTRSAQAAPHRANAKLR